MKQFKLTCIIDDDDIFVYGIRMLMRHSKINADHLVFKNGKEAIDYFKEISKLNKEIPELVLLDLNMPIMDGWGFLDEFVKLDFKKQITLYIVSSSIDPADIGRAKEYTAVNDFIIKPVTKKALETIFQ